MWGCLSAGGRQAVSFCDRVPFKANVLRLEGEEQSFERKLYIPGERLLYGR